MSISKKKLIKKANELNLILSEKEKKNDLITMVNIKIWINSRKDILNTLQKGIIYE